MISNEGSYQHAVSAQGPKCEILTTSKCFPLYPQLRTLAGIAGSSPVCHLRLMHRSKGIN
jgi:hypothetical protein